LFKVKIKKKRQKKYSNVTPIISGTGKATNFKFYRIDRNESPLKISGKVAVGVLGDSRRFSWHPYTRRIARSSLR